MDALTPPATFSFHNLLVILNMKCLVLNFFCFGNGKKTESDKKERNLQAGSSLALKFV